VKVKTPSGVGILSIGTYLPDEIRTNDWWPSKFVEKWKDRHVWDRDRATQHEDGELPEGALATIAAIAEASADPFQGSRERRVMPKGLSSVDMEVLAAEQAIGKAGLDRGEIDLLLDFALVPDYINTPNACALHHRLGLSAKCFTMNADAVCNSFQMQLTLAEQMIASSRARYGLLVQSSAIWRVNPPQQPFSIHFGDGATAVLVGRVADGKGVLGQSHRTDGSVYRALLCTVEGKNWWDDGRVLTTSLDRKAARSMFLHMVEYGRAVVGESLDLAGCAPEAVDFFAAHQPTIWFRRVAQEHIGLKNARTVDTYPWAGTLSAANLPLVLSEGERLGLLRDGDLVAMYQGGTGMTYSGTVMRWGR
jgi:3-oxoacyl-[acyl-carrier-protein] synthase-3